MITRRSLLQAIAALPLVGHAASRALAEPPLVKGEIGTYEGVKFIETEMIVSQDYYWLTSGPTITPLRLTLTAQDFDALIGEARDFYTRQMTPIPSHQLP